ncbi:MAG TPA: lysophospholipid acyltransferase family protein [Candidatus Thermoplasmatota archaeon]|nr:lysophospholipid acyltransferase family protein [Candidatus Thermoplasmatota archaeon]
MPERKRRLRLRRWPTEDWDHAHAGYRFIKTTFQLPVAWASRLHVKGRENVPSAGPVLLAVNHQSWADPVLVGAAIHRPAFYLAKEGLFRNRLAGTFFSALGQIKVNRDTGGNEDVIRTAVDCLRRGLVVGVFPEGTRSRPGEVRRGRTGIARIAALSGAPVVPVGVDTGDFWPKHAALPRLGAKVYLRIGAPMDLRLSPGDAEDRQKMRDATDDVMERVAALLREAVAAKEANEKWR